MLGLFCALYRAPAWDIISKTLMYSSQTNAVSVRQKKKSGRTRKKFWRNKKINVSFVSRTIMIENNTGPRRIFKRKNRQQTERVFKDNVWFVKARKFFFFYKNFHLNEFVYVCYETLFFFFFMFLTLLFSVLNPEIGL